MDTTNSQITVRADFLNDLRNSFSEKLREFGAEPDDDAETEALCRMISNMKRRTIRMVPRPVNWSRELRARPLTADQRDSLGAIERISRAGGALNPFLHKRLMDPGYDDLLLNDWGIHHMHLGKPVVKGFVERTLQVLFVLVRSEGLFFIDVRPHGSKYPLWTCETELVDIIHTNWPELIADEKAPGVISAQRLSAEQVKGMRSESVNESSVGAAAHGSRRHRSSVNLACSAWGREPRSGRRRR